MPGQKPNPIEIFRIVHISNVEYVLTHGMFTKNHNKADPQYINIGDSNLIAQRNVYPVGISPPGGNLGDYVPFYFGPLSPMLLNIKTGYRGITKRPQSEIVYIVCEVGKVIAQCKEWCFTNGHAKDSFTDFFNNLADVDEVHWDVVKLRYWNPTAAFLDRQAKKQAEFLVKNTVPVSCISKIIVYNQQTCSLVLDLLKKLKLGIPVLKNPNNEFYY
jgi:ssDNA thymidine ADP-ribosyltransferase, DarT